MLFPARRHSPLRLFLIAIVAWGAILSAVPSESSAAGTLLILLDRSASMANSNKWLTASTSIVQALDGNAVDTLSVGLIAAPAGTVSGPACVFSLPVPCAAPTLPQISIAAAGSQKSTAPSGVRRSIKDWLTLNSPQIGTSDGLPLYAATVNALSALNAVPGTGPRTLLILTDGGISCGSLASPVRPGYTDCNGCSGEWDAPTNLVQLLDAARNHPTTPVQTLVVGLPGSNTTGATCDEPPYSTRLALSAIAFAGSPAQAQPGCTGTIFTQGGGDPSLACHRDLSSGFSGAALTGAINQAIAASGPSSVPSSRGLGIASLVAMLVAVGATLMARRARA